MNKIEFLTRLKNSLEKNGLSKEDTDDALNYYEEIFMDAGFGKDAETAESLGSPEMVAEGILRENGIEINRNDGFTNSTNIQQNIPVQKKSSSDTALKIILLVISFPIWLPVVVTVFALLFAFFVVIMALGFAFVVSSIAVLVSGIQILFESPALALMGLGAGLVGCGITFFIVRSIFTFFAPTFVKLVKKLFGAVKRIFVKEDKKYEY